jgi:hypothetical protein
MRNGGIGLLVFGVGAFILPYFGLQFKILSIFGDALPMVAGGLALAGAVMLALSFRGEPQAPAAK